MPIFRSAIPYISAYGFQYLILLAGVLVSQAMGSVHCVEDVVQTTSSTQCTLPTAQLPKNPASSIKCWKPYAVIYGLVLLKLGIMMPRTC